MVGRRRPSAAGKRRNAQMLTSLVFGLAVSLGGLQSFKQSVDRTFFRIFFLFRFRAQLLCLRLFFRAVLPGILVALWNFLGDCLWHGNWRTLRLLGLLFVEELNQCQFVMRVTLAVKIYHKR